MKLTLNVERNGFTMLPFDMTPVDGAAAVNVLLVGLCIRSSYDHPTHV